MVKSATSSRSDQYFSRTTGNDTGLSRLVEYESIDGRYGRKNSNLCEHIKERVVLDAFVEYDYPGWGSRFYTNQCNSDRGDQLFLALAPFLDGVEYKMLNGFYKKIDPRDIAFNLFNFLYEAREIPSLMDPAKVVGKRLGNLTKKRVFDSASKRKFAKEAISDIQDTYLNATFGYVPTISDTSEITSRLTSLKDSYQRVKALASKRGRTRYWQDLPRLEYQNVVSSYFDKQSRIVIDKAWISVSGKYWYEVPMLNSFAFLSSGLDRMGIHFDLATIWNALPWSWLIDWVVPIGDALEANRTGWTEIIPKVKGSVSWKFSYTEYFPSWNDTWAGRPPTFSQSGRVTGTYYLRNPIGSLEEYRYPPAEFLSGWNNRKTSILAALARFK